MRVGIRYMALSGVALYGGSFNPIHHGHLIVARAVAEHLGLARVVLIPAAKPPHKEGQPLADARDRLEMCRLAVAGEPLLEVSDLEFHRDGPSYTFDTVSEFRRRLGAEETLCWIIGADTLPELHLWYRIRELVDRCRIVTAVRPGYDAPDLSPLLEKLSVIQVARLQQDIIATPGIDISATDIRDRVRQGRSIRYLVPEAVCGFIERRQLYRAAP